MDGRKKSLGQVLVVAATLMIAGTVRGEAMAKASIESVDNVSAAGGAGAGGEKIAAPTKESAESDLPAAFRMPLAGAARPIPVKAGKEEMPAASAKTNDVAVPAQPGDAGAAAAGKPELEGSPKTSEIEASPIGGSSSRETPAAKATTGNGTVSGTATVGMPGLGGAFQVATALTVVIGLIFIGKALARKFVPGAKASNGKGVIEILARYPLCKNQSLVLVRIGSQIVTLNQCKESSQSVLVISDPNEVSKLMGQIEGQSPNSIQAGFTKLLANARMDLEDPANDPDRNDFELRSMEPENLDNQLEEMASAKRQLMQLRQQVRSVRDSLPRS